MTEEIRSLVARAKRYIKSAGILIKEGDFESSVSRSYYAMFYAAEALLLTKKLKFSSHRGVISQFGNHFIKTGLFNPEMGKHLRNAFDRRLVGDYSFAPTVTKTEAQESLDWAVEFTNVIENYLTEKGYL